MNTIKIIIFATFFIIIPHLKAQDSTKSFSFPHKTGDMWEYFYSDGPMYVDTLQNFTIFDSTDSKGIIYIHQHARFINPIGPSVILSDTMKYWIDSLNNNVYSKRDRFDTVLIYKLKVKLGDQWVTNTIRNDDNSINGYSVARVIKKWEGSLFGVKTTFMELHYFDVVDSSDTSGFTIYANDVLADGFGLVSSGGGEAPGQILIIGAVINGTLYGDTTKITGIKNKDASLGPNRITLFQNYPNPFNPTTTIAYSLPKSGNVKLTVYNAIGSKVATIVNEYKPAGNYSVQFKGSNLASGIYFYRLESGNYSSAKKFILMK